MGDVTMELAAYAKIILHAAKYPYCAVNGVFLADGNLIRDGVKNQDLHIVDSVPLFHHSHYVSPMAEIALTQIETKAQEKNRVVAGYYAACENFSDNSVNKCPGQKIADKIVEYLPSAIFVVIDNKQMMQHMDSLAIKLHKYIDGKWKPRNISEVIFTVPHVLPSVSHMLERNVHHDLVDFDNFLDDQSQDWSNRGIEKLINSINCE